MQWLADLFGVEDSDHDENNSEDISPPLMSQTHSVNRNERVFCPVQLASTSSVFIAGVDVVGQAQQAPQAATAASQNGPREQQQHQPHGVAHASSSEAREQRLPASLRSPTTSNALRGLRERNKLTPFSKYTRALEVKQSRRQQKQANNTHASSASPASSFSSSSFSSSSSSFSFSSQQQQQRTRVSNKDGKSSSAQQQQHGGGGESEDHRFWLTVVIPRWDMLRQSRVTQKLWADKGIPPDLRGMIWPLAIGNHLAMDKEEYFRCLDATTAQRSQRSSLMHGSSSRAVVSHQEQQQDEERYSSGGAMDSQSLSTRRSRGSSIDNDLRRMSQFSFSYKEVGSPVQGMYGSPRSPLGSPLVGGAAVLGHASSPTPRSMMRNNSPMGSLYSLHRRSTENMGHLVPSHSPNSNHSNAMKDVSPNRQSNHGRSTVVKRDPSFLRHDAKRMQNTEEGIEDDEEELEEWDPDNADEELLRQVKDLLSAVGHYNSDFEYVQGLAYIATVLMTFVSPVEQCFSVLLNFLSDPSRGMVREMYPVLDFSLMQRRFIWFDQVLHHNAPKLYSRFRRLNLMPDMYLTEWWVPLFAKTLNVGVVARVWDGYMLFGDIYWLQAAMALLLCLWEDKEPRTDNSVIDAPRLVRSPHMVLLKGTVSEVIQLLREPLLELTEQQVLQGIARVKIPASIKL